MPLLLALALPIALASLAGCSTYTPVGAPYVSADAPLPPPHTTPYKMLPGDVLSIRFYGNAELNEDVPIRPDGAISLPFVGDVKAAGLSPAELDQDLTHRYSGELRSPQIVVVVKEFGSQRVWVGGEVSKPGMIAMKGPLSLFAALQEAGGLLPTARPQQVVLIRPDGGGKPLGRTIDVRPLQSGARPEQDVMLQAMDVIFVPRSRISSVDVWVDQYIKQLLPVSPGLGFYVGPSSSSSSH
ncbi:MAG: polysaccharide export protein [Acidobacteria bacterium]|nr:polysaccharide export protein [Acidobacteriota bacterium]